MELDEKLIDIDRALRSRISRSPSFRLQFRPIMAVVVRYPKQKIKKNKKHPGSFEPLLPGVVFLGKALPNLILLKIITLPLMTNYFFCFLFVFSYLVEFTLLDL